MSRWKVGSTVLGPLSGSGPLLQANKKSGRTRVQRTVAVR